MKFLAGLASLTALATANVVRETIPAGANIVLPREPEPQRPGGWKGKHHNDDKDEWGCNKPSRRHVVTIRASKDPHDDVADDFLWGMQKANNGGTLHLKRGEQYVLGKTIDLTFLNDVHVRLDGEIMFTDDIEYWQANSDRFYIDFQNSTSYWAWGGEKIRIYGEGRMNGQGQAW